MKSSKKFKFLCFTIVASVTVYSLIWNSLRGVSPVPGWEEHMSRNVNFYVREDIRPHSLPPDFCKGRKLLLVVICSKPDGFLLRQAIRETWGQKHNNASFFFLLGEVGDNFELQHQLDMEKVRFVDIIQERFLDTYNNLTLKSVQMLKLFKIHCTESHTYLMKVDDDIFLNVPLIIKDIEERNLKNNLLLGHVRNGTAPYRYSGSKWYMPYTWYPEATYPDFLCGPAYLMSVDVAEKLYRCSLETPLLHTEDVYLTGLCSLKMNISLTHSALFTCNSIKENVCEKTHFHTLHYYTPEKMRKLYDTLKSGYCEDEKYFNVVLKWIFFFYDF